jgi:NDP-sugar pyrophosphorylase family protein
MKGLIIAKEEPTAWVKNYFRGIDPYLLKIANKPLLEYFVDLMEMIGIQEIRFVYDYPSCEINKHFGDGTKWGMKFSYSLSKTEDSLKKIYLKNISFAKESELLIINGYNFLKYDKNNISHDTLNNLVGSTPSGCINIVKYENYKETLECINQQNNELITPIDSIQTYYKLSMMAINDLSNHFVLPGYSSEDQVFIGADTSYPKTVSPDKPIMLGDHTRIHDMVILGPNVIIGVNSIVDSMTTVKDSIIYDNTYIGQELDIIGKIVYKNTLISAISGESINMSENFLLSGVEKKYLVSTLQLLVQYFMASILFIVQLIPFLLMSPFIRYWEKKYFLKKYHLMDKSFRAEKFCNFNTPKKSPLLKLFLHLSLDKFLLLPKFFKGDLLLIGNKIFEDCKENRYIIRDLPFYKPGIFYYSESIGRDFPEEVEIHERVYSSEPTFLREQGIFYKTILKRIMGMIID